ncbi:MAG: protein kinase [Polyangiaceae bacterium]
MSDAQLTTRFALRSTCIPTLNYRSQTSVPTVDTNETTYRPLLELGRGGMGTVTLSEARQSSDEHRLVAIKKMLPELATDPHARAMFLREARLLSRIDHPNVVRTISIEPGDEQHPAFIVMELVDGVSLREVLREHPKGLPVTIAARIAYDIAQGLHAAHEARDEQGDPLHVVHRDVSPHNAILTFDGVVKLLDFGVAKTTEGTRTVTGEVKGKLGYMAPEQAMGDHVDRRADIYALGAVLYELLSGKRMHGEGTDLEILRRIAQERPAPIESLVSDLPPALIELMAQMIQEDPSARPSTALEVANALSKCFEREELAVWVAENLGAKSVRRARAEAILASQEETRPGSRPPPAITPLTSPAREVRTSNPKVTIGVAAALLALFAIAGQFLPPAQPPFVEELAQPRPSASNDTTPEPVTSSTAHEVTPEASPTSPGVEPSNSSKPSARPNPTTPAKPTAATTSPASSKPSSPTSTTALPPIIRDPLNLARCDALGSTARSVSSRSRWRSSHRFV